MSIRETQLLPAMPIAVTPPTVMPMSVVVMPMMIVISMMIVMPMMTVIPMIVICRGDAAGASDDAR